jgi:hypothetical protein
VVADEDGNLTVRIQDEDTDDPGPFEEDMVRMRAYCELARQFKASLP